MADLYAPTRNFGGDLITFALVLNMTVKSTLSKLRKAAFVALVTSTSSKTSSTTTVSGTLAMSSSPHWSGVDCKTAILAQACVWLKGSWAQSSSSNLVLLSRNELLAPRQDVARCRAGDGLISRHRRVCTQWCVVGAHHQKFGPSSNGVGGGNVLSGPKSQQFGTRPPKIPRRWDRGGSQSRPPAPSEVHAAAVDRVHRLEAAIEALGVGSEEAKGLEEALVRAKRGANLAPVGERLDSTAQFVERCKKRLQSAEAGVKEAIVFRDKAVAKMEAGQRNLETLRAEAATQAQEPRIQQVNHHARAHGRGSSIEISSCRIGVRTAGVPQETHKIVVSALSRHPSSAKSVPHGVGCVPRPASWTGQRFQDGSFDQSGSTMESNSNRFNPLS